MRFSAVLYPLVFRRGFLLSLWPETQYRKLPGRFKVRYEFFLWWACWQFHWVWWSRKWL